jgi:hypothetical protein
MLWIECVGQIHPLRPEGRLTSIPWLGSGECVHEPAGTFLVPIPTPLAVSPTRLLGQEQA